MVIYERDNVMSVNENTLEQAIISDLQDKGYEYIFGPDIDRDYHEVILRDAFDAALFRINAGITASMIEETYKTIKNLGLLKLEDINAAFHKYLIEGVPVPYKKDGENRTFTVKLVDFEYPENNDFKVINQFTVIDVKQKRPDILIFINGIPMVLFELKNTTKADTTIENAYNQIKNYQLDMPTLFAYNAFNVISDGLDTKMGTITANFNRYMAWKSEDGKTKTDGAMNFFTVMLNGVFPKERLLDIIRNFIVFQNIKGKTVKIIAAYHQYYAVKKAVERTKKSLDEETGKVGVVWHTREVGKAYLWYFIQDFLLATRFSTTLQSLCLLTETIWTINCLILSAQAQNFC